jgi:hypothetical protein
MVVGDADVWTSWGREQDSFRSDCRLQDVIQLVKLVIFIHRDVVPSFVGFVADVCYRLENMHQSSASYIDTHVHPNQPLCNDQDQGKRHVPKGLRVENGKKKESNVVFETTIFRI